MGNRVKMALLLACLAAGLLGCAAPSTPPVATTPKPAPIKATVHAFNEAERDEIRSYYEVNPLAPGLLDSAALSPEERALIRRGERLPPGVGFALPRTLERSLTVLPRGYMRLRVGIDVILLDIDTQKIVDVLPDVVKEVPEGQ